MNTSDPQKTAYEMVQDMYMLRDGLNIAVCRYWSGAKAAAIKNVENMGRFLTIYGEANDELQNMDRYFAFLEQVKEEIKKL